jgi:hypothetical protein
VPFNLSPLLLQDMLINILLTVLGYIPGEAGKGLAT